MDAVLAKLGKKLGRKPLLKRKGAEMESSKPAGMTVVIGMGKPMAGRGPMKKREDDEPMDEMEPEAMSAKLDALMERMDALEAKLSGESGDEDMDEEETRDIG
jgi:hypothetical protein